MSTITAVKNSWSSPTLPNLRSTFSAPSVSTAKSTTAQDHVQFSSETAENGPGGVAPKKPSAVAGHKSPSGGASLSSHTTTKKPESSGEKAVQLAKKFLGEDSIDVKGHLKNYQAAGGVTNDCADFATSIEMDTGRLKNHEINVGVEGDDLPQEGWEPVSQKAAQPGDLVIFPSYHTAIVENKGATEEIGSNGTSVESISEVPTWGPADYYKPDWEK